MDDRVVQFRVGVVVVATAIIAAILVLLFVDARTLFQRSKTVTVTLPRAPGIAPDTPVRKNGVLVGRVESVDLKGREVVVSIALSRSDAVFRDDTCQVSSTLLGDASLELVSVEDATTDELVRAGDRLQGRISQSPMEILVGLEDNLESAVDSFGEAGLATRDASIEINELAGRVNSLLADNDEQLRRVLNSTEQALEGFNRAMGTFDNVFGDPQVQENLRRGLSDLPELVADTREAMSGIQQAVVLADENLRNLQGFTEPLGDRGEALIAHVESSMKKVDVLLADFTNFSQAINSREGTIGQLLHNPELYNNLNRTVTNIEQVSRQLRPILYDVRVFSDKIARDPGRIGVSGVLRQRSGLK